MQRQGRPSNSIIDELADLIQDQEDQADGRTNGRRTRGVKIDFAGKSVPEEGDDDDDDEEENVPEVEEEVVGKGKGKPVSKVGSSSKSAEQTPRTSSSKPVSKA